MLRVRLSFDGGEPPPCFHLVDKAKFPTIAGMSVCVFACACARVAVRECVCIVCMYVFMQIFFEAFFVLESCSILALLTSNGPLLFCQNSLDIIASTNVRSPACTALY